MPIGVSPATPEAATATAAPGRRLGGRPDRVLGVFSRMASLTWLRLKPVIWQMRALGNPASKKSVRARRRSASVRCFVPMAEGPSRLYSELGRIEGSRSRGTSSKAGARGLSGLGNGPRGADDGQSGKAQSEERTRQDGRQDTRAKGGIRKERMRNARPQRKERAIVKRNGDRGSHLPGVPGSVESKLSWCIVPSFSLFFFLFSKLVPCEWQCETRQRVAPYRERKEYQMSAARHYTVA